MLAHGGASDNSHQIMCQEEIAATAALKPNGEGRREQSKPKSIASEFKLIPLICRVQENCFPLRPHGFIENGLVTANGGHCPRLDQPLQSLGRFVDLEAQTGSNPLNRAGTPA